MKIGEIRTLQLPPRKKVSKMRLEKLKCFTGGGMVTQVRYGKFKFHCEKMLPTEIERLDQIASGYQIQRFVQ